MQNKNMGSGGWQGVMAPKASNRRCSFESFLTPFDADPPKSTLAPPRWHLQPMSCEQMHGPAWDLTFASIPARSHLQLAKETS